MRQTREYDDEYLKRRRGDYDSGADEQPAPQEAATTPEPAPQPQATDQTGEEKEVIPPWRREEVEFTVQEPAAGGFAQTVPQEDPNPAPPSAGGFAQTVPQEDPNPAPPSAGGFAQTVPQEEIVPPWGQEEADSAPQEPQAEEPAAQSAEAQLPYIIEPIMEESAVEPEPYSMGFDGALDENYGLSQAMDKDDALIRQIDEFRARAMQLQQMLDTRESKAQEMQSMVDERQQQVDALNDTLRARQRQVSALDDELKEKQDQADKISAGVERQLDVMIERVGVKMNDIESEVRSALGDNRQIDAMIERVSTKMDEIESAVRDDIGENSKLTDEKAQEMKENLVQIQEQLVMAKSELSEKVHSESVMCFRNLQNSLSSVDNQMNMMTEAGKNAKQAKSYASVAVVLALFDLIGIIAALAMLWMWIMG